MLRVLPWTVVLLLACRPSSQPAPPPPEPEPEPAREPVVRPEVPEPEPDAEPEPAPDPDPDVGPIRASKAADPNWDRESERTWMAVLHSYGAVYDTAGQLMRKPRDGRPKPGGHHLRVLDPHVRTNPRRMALLCGTKDYRFEVEMDASSFQTVASRGAALGATPTTDRKAKDAAAIWLRTTTPVTHTGRTDNDRHEAEVRVKCISGKGWAPIEEIDVAYTGSFRDKSFKTVRKDAWIHDRAEIYDAPGGQPFATLSEDGDCPQIEVKVGQKQGDWSYVDFAIYKAHVSGWIRNADLHSTADPPKPEGFGGGGYRSGRPGGTPLTVPAGQVILGTQGQPIGVFLNEAEAGCVDACESDHPRLQLRDCSGVLDLDTRPPGSVGAGGRH